MRGAVQLAAASFAALGVACATTVDVAFDEGEDFSRYRTWDWLPRAARTVNAPLGQGPALDARVARLVERALRARGFERTDGRADLFVSYYLQVQRELVTVRETPAMQYLSSFHSSPSYWIQATQSRLHTYERGRLVIVVSGRRQQRVIWRGEIEGRFQGDFSPHLREVVWSLLERFPPPRKAATPAPAPPSSSRQLPGAPGNEREERRARGGDPFSIGIRRVMIGLASREASDRHENQLRTQRG